jgi:alpha-tubulin suppressor-like RCC1 family protein
VIHDISIKEVHCADSYTLALSEMGEVFTWGRGNLGHLGNGSERSEVLPYHVQFNFKEEERKIQQTRANLHKISKN